MDLKTEEQLRMYFEQMSNKQDLFMKISQILVRLEWPEEKKNLNLFIMSVLKRCISTIEGIKILFENKNFTCAAPLTRVFVDNLVRIHAFILVDDPDGLATKVLSGKKIKNLQDRNGKNMYDSYLIKSLSSDYEWLKDVYEQTSGRIHLSNLHHLDMIVQQRENQNSITSKYYMGKKDIQIPIHSWLEITVVINKSSLGLSKLLRTLLGNQLKNL